MNTERYRYVTASSEKTEFDILSESPPSGRHVEFWGFFIVSGSEKLYLS